MTEPAGPDRTLRIASTSAITLGSQIGVMGISFVASVLLARALGPTGKGQLTLLLQIPATIAMVANLGLPGANAYYVGTRRHDTGTVAANSFLIAMLATVIGLPLIWLFTLGPLSAEKGLTPLVVGLAALTLPLSLMVAYYSGIATGLQELPRQAVANLAGALANAALVGAAFLAGALRLPIAVLAQVALLALTLAFLLGPVLSRAASLRPSLRALRESWRYAAKSYLGNLTGYLNYRQDVFFVGYLAGVSALGLYSIAVTFAELMWYVPNALASTILAKSLTAHESTGAEFTARSSRLTFAIMLVLSVILALIMRPLLAIVYTSRFVGAAVAFYWLLPGIVLLGVGKILSSYLAARGKVYASVGVASAAINLVANLLLVRPFGITGAAFASTLSYSFAGLMLMWLFGRETGLPLRDILLLHSDDARAIKESLASYLRRGR